MRIAITGASGLVGAALAPALVASGHEVIAVSRRERPGGVRWDPDRQAIDPAALRGIDAVVHLAGENLAGGRWTSGRKHLLRDSRVAVTRWLATVLAALSPRPRVLISASAVGIYGDRGDEILDDTSSPGDDFLAHLSRDWEAAADPAREAGIRVFHPRFGVILSPAGGALRQLLTPFRLGLGGPIGAGGQWMSWIALDDAVAALEFALATESLSGAANCTAPTPVRNREFTALLGAALHRPARIPVPAFALRLAFGEMADATILASQRALPQRLEAAGFRWRHPELAPALRDMLARPR